MEWLPARGAQCEENIPDYKRPTCIAAGRPFLANNNKGDDSDDSFSDTENRADNEHEDADGRDQG